MNIIQILHGNYILGGMEKLCLDLSNELAETNNVMLIADPCFKQYASTKVIFIDLDITKSRYNIFFLYSLFKTIKSFHPDIIHCHKQKSIEIIKLLDKFLKTPLVATKHDIKNKKAYEDLNYVISISDKVTQTINAKNIYKIYNIVVINQGI